MRSEREAVLNEVEKVPGVEVDFQKPGRGRHFRAVLRYRDRSRFVVMACSGSDRRGVKNLACDVRKQLRELGALA